VAPAAPPRARSSEPTLKVESTGDMVLSPRARRGRGLGWVKFFIGALVFVVLGSGVAVGVVLLIRYLPGDDNSDLERMKTRGNFAFSKPPGWREDKNLQFAMQVPFALTQRKPRSHMALIYRDDKTRQPSDAEMLDVALKHLRFIFATVDYEDPFQGKQKGRTGTLGGEPAIVVEFQGTGRDEVVMRGQVYILTRQGYTYWIWIWCPEDYHDEARESWETLRGRFKLFNQRDGWKPRPPETEPFAVPDMAVRLDWIKGLWSKEDNPKDYDEMAVLALRGFEPTEDEETGKKHVVKLAGKAATVLVLVLPPAQDVKSAHAAALERIKKKQMETYSALKVEPVKRKNGKPIVGVEVGALRGEWSKLQLKLDEENSHFGLLAVVTQPKGVLAIFCECDWKRRDFWDQEFKALVETVRRSSAKR
jgi:hypothetical protein